MDTKLIKRAKLMGGLLTLLFLCLAAKLYYEQVLQGEQWLDDAKNRWLVEETVTPPRGKIVDRNNNILAMDTVAYTVSVSPSVIHEVGNAIEIVNFLNKVLGKPKAELREIVNARRADGTYYQSREVRREGWKISTEVADQIRKFRIAQRDKYEQFDIGITLTEETTRFYPKGTLGAHVLGYIRKDGNPVGGIEKSLNMELSGTKGYLQYARDGNKIRKNITNIVKAKPGHTLQLTIDMDIQQYMQTALNDAFLKYKPKSITAIAADPSTMDILALANYPTYDPNRYWDYDQVNFADPAVEARYEPGSTFKILTLAAAVQEQKFNPNEYYLSGKIKVADREIRDVKRGGWGSITFLEGLKRSSNVAFVKLGYERLQANKLTSYIKSFGFADKTNIQLPGEIRGKIDINPTNPVDVATAAFGQGPVAVTPIQQLAAVAAVANGGKLYEPHLLKQVVDASGNIVQKVEPKLIRQVISPETSTKVSAYLEKVVSDREIGSGKSAYIDGYRVAGKTGTAQKVINGQYSNSKFVVSFIGYAPVENPKIIVYIVVDEPNDPLATGGSVAAPIFKQIVQKSLQKIGVAPRQAKAETAKFKKTVTIPDLRGMTVQKAKDKLIAAKLAPEVVGAGNTIKSYVPAAGAKVARGQRVFIITEELSKLTMPDMTGLPLRDALELCSLLHIKVVTQGNGFVAEQIMTTMQGEKVLKLILISPEKVNNDSS